MVFVSNLLVILPLFLASETFAIRDGYYWREYTGEIPSDAVVVGKDIRGNDLYVGQAYVKSWGWQVVPIYRGDREVNALLAGVRKTDRYIKILCGNQENFRWILTNAKNLKDDLKGKVAVVGGHEDGWGDINIGRISYEGETKIGKINAFHVGKSKLHFHDRGMEKSTELPYEVLIYQEGGLLDPRVSK